MKKQAGDSRYIYQNELDKACCQHEMSHEDFKDSTRGRASDKVLHNKARNISNNLTHEVKVDLLHKSLYFLIKNLVEVVLLCRSIQL